MEKSDDKPLVRVRAVDRLFGGDKIVWVVTVILLIISLYVSYSQALYSASATYIRHLFVKQLMLVVAGFGIVYCMQFVPCKWYKILTYPAFLGAAGATLAVLLFGQSSNEAERVLRIGSFSFMPLELLKITVVWALARELGRRQSIIGKEQMIPSLWIGDWFKPGNHNKEILFKHTLPLLLPTVIACCLTVKIGNSTTMIIVLSCLIMFFIGRMRYSDLLRVIVLFVVAGASVFLLLSAIKQGRTGTAESRFEQFRPDMIHKHVVVGNDGLEYYSNEGEAEQAKYAKVAIAAGGFAGRGPGMSATRVFLAKADKDMAYAFYIEEYGTWGAVAIVLLFLIFFFRSVKIFNSCGTAFPGFVVLGLSMMFVLQAIMHMMVSVSLFPITGQQLPIISRGGSSLIFLMISVGMIVGISRQEQRNTLDCDVQIKK